MARRRRPGLRPVERLIYRSAASTRARAALDRLRAARCSRSASSASCSSTCCSGCRAGCRSTRRTCRTSPPALSFNTAVSFVTNTNWQSYCRRDDDEPPHPDGRARVQNFVSAAVGIAVAVALIRAWPGAGQRTIGNFWVDLIRTTLRILLPLAFVVALVLVTPGRRPELPRLRPRSQTVAGRDAGDPGRTGRQPGGDQELGTNGGGFFNANSAHPFENPNGFTNFFEISLILLIPFALDLHVREDGQGPTAGLGGVRRDVRRSGSLAALSRHRCSRSTATRSSTTVGRRPDGRPPSQPGGNLEGKEIRFGPPRPALCAPRRPAPRPAPSTRMHDSFTPLGGLVPLVNMMLGEVSPGRRRRRAVRDAGLRAPRRVHRRPDGRAHAGVPGQEDPGARDEARRALHPGGAARACSGSSRGRRSSDRRAVRTILNPGPHGFTEIVYAFTSAANNNGSAFGGLTGDHRLVNTTARARDARRPVPADHPGSPSPARSPASSTCRRPPARSRPTRRSSPAARRRDPHRRRLTFFPALALGPTRRAARHLEETPDRHRPARRARRERGRCSTPAIVRRARLATASSSSTRAR